MIVSQTLLPSLQEAITCMTDPTASGGKQIKLGLTFSQNSLVKRLQNERRKSAEKSLNISYVRNHHGITEER